MPDIDQFVASLERRYRVATNEALIARADYLSIAESARAMTPDVLAAKSLWERLEARRQATAAELSRFEPD